MTLASDLIENIAPSLGVRVAIEPIYRYVGQIILPDGRKTYFRNTNFDLNGQGAAELARDKAYAAYFMSLMGYPVIAGRTFYSSDWCQLIDSSEGIDSGYAYAKALGFPVVVKPNSKSQGAGVSKVYGKRDFYRAMHFIFRKLNERVAIVQPFIGGIDYRVVVLDGEVISAYRRIPLRIIGNGQSTILELLAERQMQFRSDGRGTRILISDPRIAVNLRRLRLSPDAVPRDGETVQLLDNANLSTGGEAEDVTEELHEEYRVLAARLARDMALRFCGIDLISTAKLDQPHVQYWIVEVNAAPGLDHYAHIGEKQRALVTGLYERVLASVVYQHSIHEKIQ